MPLQNRVTPFAQLVASPVRGLLMGNRGGRIHDPVTRRLTGRRWVSRRWICCVTRFRGRHRQVWGRSYTELFFLDEVTALAAGHRPCMECRRADALAYRQAVSRALGLEATILCDNLDRLLHEERVAKTGKQLHHAKAEDLPDGAMVVGRDGEALALRGDEALAWAPAGYGARRRRPTGAIAVLTPPTSLEALAHGYESRWHPSAEP